MFFASYALCSIGLFKLKTAEQYILYTDKPTEMLLD